MTNLYRKFFATGVGLLLMVFTITAFTAFEARAQQQTPYYDLSTPEVSIDLSVLNDGGRGMPRTGSMSPSVRGGSLLMPGGRPPQSQLLVSPKRKPRVTRKIRSSLKRKIARKVRKSTRKSVKRSTVATTPKRAKKPTRTASIKKTKSAPPLPPITMTPKTSKAPPPAPIATSAATKTPPAVTKPALAKQPKQQASLQPTSTSSSASTKNASQSVLVTFQVKSAKVPAAMKSKLKSLAASIKGKGDQRLQLMAYAGGPDISPSKARRLSLSRALAVRSYLISTGVRSTRIDVRALGNKTTVKPINRVDVTVVKR